MSLPEWLIYRKNSEHSEIEIRKVNDDKEAGIRVTQSIYDFPGELHAETFINKHDAKELIKALKEYFNL